MNSNLLQKITLDMTISRIQNISCSQDDTDSRSIEITLSDNGQPYSIPGNTGIYLKIAKPDHTYVYIDEDDSKHLKRTGDKISVVLPGQATAAPGIAKAELQFIDKSSNEVVSTRIFHIVVNKSALSDHEITSRSDSNVIKKMTAHLGDLNNPHKTGKQQVGLGNVPNVATNDQTPTYHENSSLTALSSGEKLSAAFGKIAKAVNTLISHLTLKAGTGTFGHTKLTDSIFSTSTDTAATPNSVKTAYDKALQAVTEHNESAASHNDIRISLSDLAARLNALADSDDTTLDQLSEIVSYIKSNRTLIENVTTNKVNVSDIIDSLNSTDTKKPLSARQGKVLNDLIRALTSASENKVDKISGKGLSANDYTTAEKNKLSGIAPKAEVNVQSDWNETDVNSDAYIKNKPEFTQISEFVGINGNINNSVVSENLSKYGITSSMTTEELWRHLPFESLTTISSNAQSNVFSQSLPVSKGCLILYRDGGGTRGWAEFHQYDNAAVYYARFHDSTIGQWTTNCLPLSGGTLTGSLTVPQVITRTADGLRLVNGKYGVFWRNDGSATYMLVTKEGDPYGAWTDARPIVMNNADGVCSINGNAASATKALQDGNGNVISSTYLPLSGGKASGEVEAQRISVKTTNSEAQVNAAYQDRSGRLVVSGQKNLGLYDANHSKWLIVSDVNGNVTMSGTAAKALQDGNGSVISSTYLPLSGGTVTGTLCFTDKLDIVHNGIRSAFALYWTNQTILGEDGLELTELYTDMIAPRTNANGNKLASFVFHEADSPGKAVNLLKRSIYFYSNWKNALNLMIEAPSSNQVDGLALLVHLQSDTSFFEPYRDNTMVLGGSSNRWKSIYAATPAISTSDRNLKKDEKEFDDDFIIKLVTGFIPKSYKLKENDSNRTHYGFIAQDIEALFPELGITSKDMAAFIKTPNTRQKEVMGENGEKSAELEIIPEGEDGYGFTYSLRYEELIAPLYKFCQILYRETQSQQKEIKHLNQQMQDMRERLSKLETE